MDTSIRNSVSIPTGCQDASGYEVFSHGEAGDAHVFAHRMMDQGRFATGRRVLGLMLDSSDGTRSERVHLQWHMAVFELETGGWHAAFARFRRHVLPVAAGTEDALTDAPALLWRLALAAPGAFELPWSTVRARALVRMQRPCGPFVELHNLLALAGAGDLESLDRWLQRQPTAPRSGGQELLKHAGVALRAYVAGEFGYAAATLATLSPRVTEIGGSRAQNQLFESIAQSARRQARAANASAALTKAA
ncbi:MAG: hypothetical protein JSW10_05230 [Pseudomonadota bacterium]|nr:MAG: hypothetical protein JSW10_05230 [Pseudomonadota bacterium]